MAMPGLAPMLTITPPEIEPRYLKSRAEKELPLEFSFHKFIASPPIAVLDAVSPLVKQISLGWIIKKDARLLLELTTVDLPYPGLPKALDGFTIMHLADRHGDASDEGRQRLEKCIGGRTVDIVIDSGDQYGKFHGEPFNRMAIEQTGKALRSVESKYGFFATLGDHDHGTQVVPALMDIGVQPLVNQFVRLPVSDAIVRITGIDDPYRFYTPAAKNILHTGMGGSNSENEFRMVVSHSADIADDAADAGHNLVISGHTHGGQICITERLTIRHLRHHPEFYRGQHLYKDMWVCTSNGIGTSVVPIRYKCPAQVVLYTLKIA